MEAASPRQQDLTEDIGVLHQYAGAQSGGWCPDVLIVAAVPLQRVILVPYEFCLLRFV